MANLDNGLLPEDMGWRPSRPYTKSQQPVPKKLDDCLLGRLMLDAAVLEKEAPPKFTHATKQMLYQLCKEIPCTRVLFDRHKTITSLFLWCRLMFSFFFLSSHWFCYCYEMERMADPGRLKASSIRQNHRPQERLQLRAHNWWWSSRLVCLPHRSSFMNIN